MYSLSSIFLIQLTTQHVMLISLKNIVKKIEHCDRGKMLQYKEQQVLLLFLTQVLQFNERMKISRR